MATPTPTVIVPYQNWIGYNILKSLAEYPIVSSAVIAGLSAIAAYSFSDDDDDKWRSSLLTFVVTFGVLFAVLWYYGTTLFA